MRRRPLPLRSTRFSLPLSSAHRTNSPRAAAQGGSEVSYGGDNGMWALWVGLGAVAAFIIWDLADEPDENDDHVIILPVSP